MESGSRNHEVTVSQPLLLDDGSLREPGWSRRLVQRYDRRQIKASKLRIKEWDYYLVLNERFAAAFTISDIGYIGLQSVSLLNFEEGWEHTESIMNPLPLGRMKLPADSSGGITKYEDKRLQLSFQAEQGVRRIRCQFENFHQGKNFSCELELAQPPMDSMVIATPWAEKNLKSQRFYS